MLLRHTHNALMSDLWGGGGLQSIPLSSAHQDVNPPSRASTVYFFMDKSQNLNYAFWRFVFKQVFKTCLNMFKIFTLI